MPSPTMLFCSVTIDLDDWKSTFNFFKQSLNFRSQKKGASPRNEIECLDFFSFCRKDLRTERYPIRHLWGALGH